MSEKLSFNENNSGEFPASEEDLHAVFDRMVFYVEQYGVRDQINESDDDAEQQDAKEYNDYLQDPIGTGAKLIAEGQEEKLAEFEETKAGEDEINDFISKNIDGRPVEENIESTNKYWDWAANNPDKSAHFMLFISNPSLIREAGLPDDIIGVDIFVTDNAKNPGELYAKTAHVIFRYKQDLEAYRANSPKVLNHELELEHERGSWFTNATDNFNFDRTYDNHRSGVPRMSMTEMSDKVELDDILGTNKIQLQEVEWLNNLLNLHSQHIQTPEFYTKTVEFKEKTVAERFQNALTGLQYDKNRLVQKIVGPDTWSIYEEYRAEATLAQSALSKEAVVASELEHERELEHAKDSEYEQLAIESYKANKPNEVLEAGIVDGELFETIRAITKLPGDTEGFNLEIQFRPDNIDSICFDSVYLAYRGNYQGKFIHMSAILSTDGKAIIAKSRSEGMDIGAWEQLSTAIDKYPKESSGKLKPELVEALKKAPPYDIMTTSLKDILDEETQLKLFNNVVEGIDGTRQVLQGWLSTPDFNRDALRHVMEELHIY